MKLKKQHGMIALVLLMLSSSLTAFMNKPATMISATVFIKFSDYEYYEVPVSTQANASIIESISGYYPVRLNNESINCIRDYCVNDNATWLAFNELGTPINPISNTIKSGAKYYLIYNSSETSDVEADNEAIKDLLKL